MNSALVIARKEFRDGLRNKWVAAITLLLAALAFALTFIGSSPTGLLEAKPLAVTVVSISSLTIFLIPLIALLLGYDAIVGEHERGCLLLMLTYPVSRLEIVVGKFLGQATILALATLLGYGTAGAAAAAMNGADAESMLAFVGLTISTILLGLSFLALAYLISVLVRERGTAAGMAVGVWLFFVIVYDLALMGGLVASQGRIGASVFPNLLLLNPADTYRLFNLTAFEGIRQFSGMAGLSASVHFAPLVLLAVLLAWVAIPLSLAARLFERREA
ncbi:MAG: ABC transporter permease [Hyphomicrobium sp.]|uniref:ABC transporter permease n=1 Tax=Hyphomicrobium sp. TaxID=82 RepID=UPI001327827A|nr:ABC transporter permease subunit [Hyphomicrobium sp.]KAB2943160.1 MAG: ABC transporter permease [Hyphomicrobium sp.]MBZ0208790.1 ABC transporter permease [Hyphomicrobium sp.]